VEYLEFAMDLARAAGEVLNYYASREKRVELKGRANLVTIADRESEALVVDRIRTAFPGHRILAEESGAIEAAETDSAYRWVIDPLDGTTNYAHQYPMYSVSIALEVSGSISCGAVYDPIRDEMFSAARGNGARLNGDAISVSDVAVLGDGLLLTGFPYRIEERIGRALGLFREMMLRAQAVRRGGSAALDLCHLAMGRCDGFWELDLNPWDTAAGLLVVEEAGGRVTRFGGEPFAIDDREILASNGRIHEDMQAAIAAARPIGT
jgi:myo-inositol-1(or 4)-monophosphatase